jgi:hypothetical protein
MYIYIWKRLSAPPGLTSSQVSLLSLSLSLSLFLSLSLSLSLSWLEYIYLEKINHKKKVKKKADSASHLKKKGKQDAARILLGFCNNFFVVV